MQGGDAQLLAHIFASAVAYDRHCRKQRGEFFNRWTGKQQIMWTEAMQALGQTASLLLDQLKHMSNMFEAFQAIKCADFSKNCM